MNEDKEKQATTEVDEDLKNGTADEYGGFYPNKKEESRIHETESAGQPIIETEQKPGETVPEAIHNTIDEWQKAHPEEAIDGENELGGAAPTDVLT